MKHEVKNEESYRQISDEFAELLADFSAKSSPPSRRRRGRISGHVTQKIVAELRGENDSRRDQMNGSRKESVMQCEKLRRLGKKDNLRYVDSNQEMEPKMKLKNSRGW